MATYLKEESKDLGGFTVSRILPHFKKKMVGPFIFFDRMGPANFPVGEGVNVRPHPHIGLATISYLFTGSMLHRDSLGSVQEIFPGDVNWMTAGKGIVHSERETLEVRGKPHKLDGIQCWVALPEEREEIEPEFSHVSSELLPCIYHEKTMMRLIVGEAFDRAAPVKTFSPMFYLDVICKAGAVVNRPYANQETAVYVIDGSVRIGGAEFKAGQFVLLDAEDEIVESLTTTRYMLLGGERFERPPYLYWNFVSHSKARLEMAKQRWEQGLFPTIPGDDEEHIPLPER